MIRIGVDFGGTKIEAAALDDGGAIVARVRASTPKDYEAAIAQVRALVSEAERQAGADARRVGMGIPGSVSPKSGLIRNANSTWLNGRPFLQDLQAALERPMRLANDANCLALSEAVDGAGAGSRVVLAVILGTGCGGGICVDQRLIEGFNAVSGEFGHTPLPWPRAEEVPGPACWCGLNGCLETYVSGSGLQRDFVEASKLTLEAPQIVEAARRGDPAASGALDRYVERLGRGLAVAVNLLDPDVVVLGGGMSNVDELYDRLPAAVRPWVFSDLFETPIVKAKHGDSSGVRGAAWLWPREEAP